LKFPGCFFVTGTDTGVGKTVVCALLAAGLGASYWKPVQSGAVHGLDSSLVAEWAGLEPRRILPESYILNEPLSPHLAAECQGVHIRPENITVPSVREILIIEGAGGIMVPLNQDLLILDWVKSLAVPVLIVAPNRLGVINHTLMTISVLRHAEISVMGVILNNGINNDHLRSIEHFGRVRVLAQVDHFHQLSRHSLQARFVECFG